MPSARSDRPAERSRRKESGARARRRNEPLDDKDREHMARKNANQRGPNMRRRRHRRTKSMVVENRIQTPRGSVAQMLPKRERSRGRSREREVKPQVREKPCRTTAQHKEGGRHSKSPAAGRKQRSKTPKRKRSASEKRRESLKKSYNPQPMTPVVAGIVEPPPGTWTKPPLCKPEVVDPSKGSSERPSPIVIPPASPFAGVSTPDRIESSPERTESSPERTGSSPETKRHPRQGSPEPANECDDEKSNDSSRSSRCWRNPQRMPTTPPRCPSRSRELHVARLAQDSQSRQRRRQSSAYPRDIVPRWERQTHNRAHQPQWMQSHWIQPHQPQQDWTPQPQAQYNGPRWWSQYYATARPIPTEDTGAINIVYTYVGEGCNIVELALDLRNVAPTFLVLCCFDWQMAQQMQTELMKKPVGLPYYGGRGPRPGPDELQYSYTCTSSHELIIAGRTSCIPEVHVLEEMLSPDGGHVLVVGSQSYVKVQGEYDWTLAVFGLPSRRGRGESWGAVADVMLDNSVRVMVGEFGGTAFWAGQSRLEQLMEATRGRMQSHACAIRLKPDEDDDTHAASAGESATTAFVVNGPVSRVRWKNPYSTIMRDMNAGNPTIDDASSNWSCIRRVWEKPLQSEFAAARRLWVYMGSKTSTRSETGQAQRRVRANVRAARNAGHARNATHGGRKRQLPW